MVQYTTDWSDDDIAAWAAIDEADPIEVAMVAANESGLHTSAYNTGGHACGLIQIIHGNLQAMGWHGTDDEFCALTPREQIPYVRRYLEPHKGKLATVQMVYRATFLPATVAWDPAGTTVLCGVRGPFSWAYHDNKGFDTDHKGFITGQDLANAAARATARLGPRWTEFVARAAAAMGGPAAEETGQSAGPEGGEAA